jgi:hypothetical protein
MQNNFLSEPGMATAATYQITVRGKLAQEWIDWFNGTLIDYEQAREGNQSTILTCRVRDQAELLGILNRLYSLNLPLVQMVVLSEANKVGSAP